MLRMHTRIRFILCRITSSVLCNPLIRWRMNTILTMVARSLLPKNKV